MGNTEKNLRPGRIEHQLLRYPEKGAWKKHSARGGQLPQAESEVPLRGNVSFEYLMVKGEKGLTTNKGLS